MIKRLFASLLLLTASLSAMDYKPWFGRPFQIEASADLLYQHYNSVNNGNGGFKSVNDDLFFRGGGQVAIMGEYDAEMSFTLAHTNHQHFNFDHGEITGRYLWSNDIVGDPYSIAIGATYSQATALAVHDISSFHHGKLEGKFHIAIGKEITCYDDWSSRGWWANVLGLADSGSPWIESILAYEYRFSKAIWVKIFTQGMWGFGGQNLNLPARKFRGYGPIGHRSLDLGFAIVKQFDIWGWGSLEYSYRPYAKNFPKYANRFAVNYTYPFGF